MSRFNLELAGYTDAAGKLGRPVPSGQVIVPSKIWLKGDEILWRGRTGRYQEVSRNMLNEFLRLESAESVLRFAKRWGVLRLGGEKVKWPGRASLSEGSEPVAAWLYHSRRAQAILNIAAALKQDKLGDLRDWSEIGMFVPFGRVTAENESALIAAATKPLRFGLPFTVWPLYGRSAALDLDRARAAVVKEIGSWLNCWKRETNQDVADLGLRWSEDQQRWELQIDYHGLLFAAIALQLALVIADADSLYFCSGCGRPYVRPRQRRRPKTGWANYCEECSKDGVAQRRAVESYREKRAQAARLHSGGASVSEIAEQLKTEAARVRGWLAKGGKDAKTKARQ